MSAKEWWQKPGLGIQYQIEHRPGWRWNRNYDKFNASMRDAKGNFKFNGPFCRIKEWVEFSKKKIGVDYHLMEIKWHDGICYFDTKLTDWKTPTDYGKQFAEESKKAEIPFLFYYSSIFDHNPMFDTIQPLRGVTSSYLDFGKWSKPFVPLMGIFLTYAAWFVYRYYRYTKTRFKKKKEKAKFLSWIKLNRFRLNPRRYEKYMLGQLIEIVENYRPNGLWMDWYQMNMDRSGSIVMDFMKEKYPNIILTFNNSLGWDLKWAHYLTSEFHNVNMAWTKANKFRNSKTFWELIGPAALSWDRMEERADPYEIIRMAAIIMANGGKVVYGLASQMDGTLYPEVAAQMDQLGDWYIPRRNLFREAIPIKYKGKNVPGVKVSNSKIKTIGTRLDNDYLIHLINFGGKESSIRVNLKQKRWSSVEKVLLEPKKEEIDLKAGLKEKYILLSDEDLDPVDTILRIKRRSGE